MKRKVELTGILLVLLLGCNLSLSAQRGMRLTADSTRMNQMRMVSDTARWKHMNDRSLYGHDRMYRMRDFREQHYMYGIDRGMRRDWGGGRGFGPIRRDSISHRQFGTAGMILGSIPNVTEAQKKQITDLMTRQQAEMKKLREEMQAKMLALRESYRKNVLNVLTDEQKKFVESREKNNLPVKVKTE